MNSSAQSPDNFGPAALPGRKPLGPKPHPPGKRSKNHLIALSSAAVLAVYAAGYVRTQSAAQRFQGDAAGRKPRAQPENLTQPAPVSLPVAKSSPPPAAAAAVPAAVTTATNSPPPTLAPNLSTPATAAVAPTPAEAKATPATPAIETPQTNPAPPAAMSTAAPVAAATAPVPQVAIAAATPASAAAKTASEATPAIAKPAKWKDGKFSGWGSCRHGDIEAAVEIKDGLIISAVVKSCRTAYACNVIDKVIPQVVKRQSPDIDSVSGATQSADAFYWAVYSALEEAKLAPTPTAK